MERADLEGNSRRAPTVSSTDPSLLPRAPDPQTTTSTTNDSKMAPRNLSFSPSPEASSQMGHDDGPSSSSHPTASTSTLPPPPVPSEPRKRKPSIKGQPDHETAPTPPPKPKGKPKSTPKAPTAAAALAVPPPAAGGAAPTTGKGSRGGKKQKVGNSINPECEHEYMLTLSALVDLQSVADAAPEPSNKYKDK